MNDDVGDEFRACPYQELTNNTDLIQTPIIWLRDTSHSRMQNQWNSREGDVKPRCAIPIQLLQSPLSSALITKDDQHVRRSAIRETCVFGYIDSTPENTIDQF